MPMLCSMLGMLARMDTTDCMKPVQCCEMLNRSLRIHLGCWDVQLHTTDYAAIGVFTALP